MTPEDRPIERLRRSAREMLAHGRDEWKPLRRAASLTLRILVSCVRKLRRDRASQMASALAFDTLFSLLPLLVLALIVLHSVRGLEDAGSQLRYLVVEFMVPESLLEPNAADRVTTRGGEPPTIEEFDDARNVLRQRIDGVLEELSQVSFAGIGVVGFVAFLYGATALMRTVESSFNLLHQADPPRPWSRLPLYFLLLTLGPVAVVSAHLLQARLMRDIGSWFGGWITAPIAYVTPLLATVGVLTVVFRMVPNTWVSWRAAATGALWSGVAWFAFQEFFGFYVNRASMTSLYGALALVPFFLLWIYGTWLIILAGVALSFIVQYVAPDESWALHPGLPGDPRWLLPIMVRVAEAWKDAEKVTTGRLSRELGLPPRILRPYLRLLERQGYLRGLREHSGEHVLTLGRPLQSIKVREILELGPAPPGAVSSDLLRELDRAEGEVVGDRTLEELLRPVGGETSGQGAPESVEGGPPPGREGPGGGPEDAG